MENKKSAQKRNAPPAARPARPLYKTTFHIVEEVYADRMDREPMLARTRRGSLCIDLRRAACVAAGALVCATLASLALLGGRK